MEKTTETSETLSETTGEPPDLSKEEPPDCNLRRNRQRFFGNVTEEDWNDWKWHFRNRITSLERLAELITLRPAELPRFQMVIDRYPLAITPYYFCLINHDDPDDPVAKQSLPCFDEIAFSFAGREDPLAEEIDSVVPGLVHRYPDRVLMVLTDICPVLCRHCTRKREWRHGRWVRSQDELAHMMAYIRKNRAIRDVIVSGGDPLSLSTARLDYVLGQLSSISHVEIVRIGTRFPIVLPQRIDAELCTMLSKYGPIWLNTQFNHPHEITIEAISACDRLLRSGIPINNQSVLLRGINDSVDVQRRLCCQLLKAKVRPYYLFHADEVQGTEHLRTTIDTGLSIIEGMRGFTSGLAVPAYVIDLPDGGGKVPLQPDYVVSKTAHETIFRNYTGQTFSSRTPQHAISDTPASGISLEQDAPCHDGVSTPFDLVAT